MLKIIKKAIISHHAYLPGVSEGSLSELSEDYKRITIITTLFIIAFIPVLLVQELLVY